MYFIAHLGNPYSLTKVKTRYLGSLQMDVVGSIVVWLVGFYLCCVPGLGNGYTSSEHYKSCISVYSTCDKHVESPCLLSSNKLGKKYHCPHSMLSLENCTAFSGS